MKNKAIILFLILTILTGTAGCGAGKNGAAENAPAEAASSAAVSQAVPVSAADADESTADGPAAENTAEDTADGLPGTEAEPAPESKEPVAVNALPDLPILSSYYGSEMVSDGTSIFFAAHASDNENTTGGQNDGIYRTDTSLGSFEMMARGNCGPICLEGDLLYFRSQNTLHAGLRTVDTSGTELNWRPTKTLPEKKSFFLRNGKLLYIQSKSLYISPMADGQMTYSHKADEGCVTKALPAENGIYLSAFDKDSGIHRLYLFDQETRSADLVTEIGTDGFALLENDIFFLSLLPDQPEHEYDTQNEYELMRLGADGTAQGTGITGRFGGDLLAYGHFLFYTKYEEMTEGGSAGDARTVGRPYCCDTAAGIEYALVRDEFGVFDVRISDVAAGWMYVRLYDVQEDANGKYDHDLLFSLTDAAASLVIDRDVIYEQAAVCEAVQIADAEEAEETARREEEKKKSEEERKQREDNEPYGPGTSSLYLKAGTRSACYRLVRVNGTTEFLVLLSPGQSITKTFPCGRYRLKIAEGDTWISDEEAFGPDGKYTSTDLFTFESGSSYEIGSGYQGDFHGDSQSGFTG